MAAIADAVRPANATAIAKLTDDETRTRAFALQRLAGNLGFSFGPAVGGFLAKIDFKLLFYVDAATILLAASALLWFFRFRRIAGEIESQQDSSLRSSPARDRGFLAFLALSFLSMLVFMQFFSTYPLYLRDHFRLDESQIGAVFAVNTVVIVLFEMVLIDAVRSWPLLRTIGWGSFFTCIGFAMLPLGSSGAYCVLAMLVLTAGEMLSFPLAVGYVAKRSPRGGEGAYLGWYTTMISVAFVVGPAIGAIVYGVDRDALWFASAGVATAVLIGYLMLSRKAGEATDSAEQTHAPIEVESAALPQTAPSTRQPPRSATVVE